MLRTREQAEAIEDKLLAPYAHRSSTSRGRAYPESPHPHRPDYQRDRDRVIHSQCFRRLEYKTQVFVNGTADHYRTRLTHTIEVAAVSRTLARALDVNEDLAETIALAHDIGHSPFGHVGERALNDLMKDHGGFDHNIQSLRWTELLEHRYPGHPGLNLSWEMRAGLRKHLSRTPGETLDGQAIGPFQSIEAQIADVGDDLTYYAHDVDDGLDAGLITPEQLLEIPIWRKALERARREFTAMTQDQEVAMAIRGLLDLQVENVLERSAEKLAEHQPQTPAEVMACRERLVDFTPALAEELKPLRAFLFEHVYWHPSVQSENEQAVEMMRKLFAFYTEHPECMGRQAQERIAAEGVWRTVCDYVSGMTDRYALAEHHRFVGSQAKF
ncbi:MAG: deoxyguanosinetriphosphate triphosphohydrolase [Kiritimatiellae bacterium]|nr:deoxyguanosinetriphosphate triphosphohydrolase [Kiritimatiellia bacterium]